MYGESFCINGLSAGTKCFSRECASSYQPPSLVRSRWQPTKTERQDIGLEAAGANCLLWRRTKRGAGKSNEYILLQAKRASNVLGECCDKILKIADVWCKKCFLKYFFEKILLANESLGKMNLFVKIMEKG